MGWGESGKIERDYPEKRATNNHPGVKREVCGEMGRKITIAIVSWLMCLFIIGCALFQRKDAETQFQAGEAYFATGSEHARNGQKATDSDEKAKEMSSSIEAYRRAISAYRKVADKYPGSEYAPEALYAMAASHAYIAQLLTDDSVKQKESDNAVAAYRELSEKYPQNEHAAEAFLSVGNDYYNRASIEDLAVEEKTNLYKLSRENYRQALQVHGIQEKTKATVEAYIRETEESLARDLYNAGAKLVPYEASLETKGANAPKAIPYFKEVIETVPNTDHADLSYVQLGLCYEYLGQWQDAEKAYEGLIQKYTDENGNPISPFSDNIIQALRFARDRIQKIRTRFMISLSEDR